MSRAPTDQPDGGAGPFDHRAVLNSDVSMQVQIYRYLRAEILDGLWVGRNDFPGERELAARFGVSVITSRSALERLGTEGLIVRGRGQRSRAAYTPAEANPASPPLVPPVSNRLKKRTTIELLSRHVGVAPAAACRAFSTPPGSHLWQCLRARTFDGRPDLITQNVQSAEVGKRHTLRALRNTAMLQILKSEGVEVAEVRRRFGVATPPPLVARHLAISIDDTVMTAFLTVHDVSGQIIDWVRGYAHPDRVEPEEVMDLEHKHWSVPETYYR